MGHKHTKEEILAGALETAFADGLSQLSFGRVAKHLGINDRIVVYYFPTKDDLITNVLLAMGGDLQAALAQAFTGTAADHLALTRAAWPRGSALSTVSGCGSRRTFRRPPPFHEAPRADLRWYSG